VLEEHLLVCAACQERLTETESVCARHPGGCLQIAPGGARQQARIRSLASRLFRQARTGLDPGCDRLPGGGLVGSSWLAGVYPAGVQPVAVLLQTVRGGEPVAGCERSHRPPPRAGNGSYRTSGLTAYDLKVIDQAGSPVERLRAAPADGRLRAQVPNG